MNVYLEGLNQTAAIGLAALLNTLWYATAVVILTWVVLRYSRRVNAATRYWIWTGVLGFLVILPFLPALVAHVEAAKSVVSAAAAPLATAPAAPYAIQQLAPVTLTVSSAPGSSPWPLCLLAIWAVIAGWQLARLLRGVVSVKQLKAHAKVMPAIALPVQPSRKLQVLTSGEVNSPVAVGYILPTVIMPPALQAQLEESERQDVLLHELAHLERYDDWLNLATRMLGAILVLHPLAAIVLRQIDREREMACDDFVVAHTGSAQSYARSLARLHDLRSTGGRRLLAPALLGRKVSLADRIESLLRRGREFSARASLANLGVSAFLLLLLLGAGALIPGWIAIAQTAPSKSLASMQKSACAHLPKSFCTDLPTTFEVASIKPSDPKKVRRIGYYERFPAERFTALDWSPERLIYMAYQLRPQQLEGLPSWAKSRLYDIQAKPPPGLAKKFEALRTVPEDQRQNAIRACQLSKLQMLQSLLAERFKLKAHRVTKQLPVYEIVVAKGGPKLKAAATGSHQRVLIQGSHITCVDAQLWVLARFLSMRLGRTVVDKTGLTGRYDFKVTAVDWRAGMGRSRFGWRQGLPAPANSGLSIFTAMKEQLGLKLKATKGPVQVLVVDHIEPPTPN